MNQKVQYEDLETLISDTKKRIKCDKQDLKKLKFIRNHISQIKPSIVHDYNTPVMLIDSVDVYDHKRDQGYEKLGDEIFDTFGTKYIFCFNPTNKSFKVYINLNSYF